MIRNNYIFQTFRFKSEQEQYEFIFLSLETTQALNFFFVLIKEPKLFPEVAASGVKQILGV